MATEDQVKLWIEDFNRHDAKAWAGHYTADALVFDPQYPEPLRGRDAIQKDITDFFRAFPDMSFETRSVLSNNDGVALDGVGRGTHQGPLEGPGGTIEPTNKKVEIGFAVFLRTSNDGLISEERRYYDQAGMLGQLGLM